VCVNLGALTQCRLLTPGRQRVCNMRALLLRTATVVSIDLHLHHATSIALSLSGASGMPHPSESMVKSEAVQACEVYFVFSLSLLTCPQPPGRQHVCNMRALLLRTATVVSIDLHLHHATRASSLSGASGMPHPSESMVKSEAVQAYEVYFVFSLSLHTCPQQISDFK
jgi:hypothetical protein